MHPCDCCIASHGKLSYWLELSGQCLHGTQGVGGGLRLSPGMERQGREGGEGTSRDLDGASRDGLLERRPSTFSLESASSFDLGLPRSSMEV